MHSCACGHVGHRGILKRHAPLKRSQIPVCSCVSRQARCLLTPVLRVADAEIALCCVVTCVYLVEPEKQNACGGGLLRDQLPELALVRAVV